MDIADKLNHELLTQPFAGEPKQPDELDVCRQMAAGYARTENALAVLSDMKTNTSYIFHSGLSEKLGLGRRGEQQTVHSIWEEDIFSHIHPDDLSKKQSEELRFFHFLKNVPQAKRPDYYLMNAIRMRDRSGRYFGVRHRLFYIAMPSGEPIDGSIRLALCLYNLAVDALPADSLVDSAEGQALELEKQPCHDLLSKREKEVLQLIDTGKRSKEIAAILSVSTHTVNRHRQNILEKLRVQNSIEACRIAKRLRLIE